MSGYWMVGGLKWARRAVLKVLTVAAVFELL